MKASKKETESFKPYKLEIEIQSEQEEKCLKHLFGANVRIPAQLEREGVIDESSDFYLLSQIMECIHQALNKDK